MNKNASTLKVSINPAGRFPRSRIQDQPITEEKQDESKELQEDLASAGSSEVEEEHGNLEENSSQEGIIDPEKVEDLFNC